MNAKKLVLMAFVFVLGIANTFAQSNERGIDLYRAELYGAAKLFFERQQNQTPRLEAEKNFYLGQIAYDQEQFAEANAYYKKAQSIDPEYPFGYIGEGKITLKNGDKKGAESLFKKAAGLVKKDPAIQTAIGEAYMNLKMYAEAEDALKKAEKIDKNYSGIPLVRGNRYEQEGDMGDAGRWYENAILFDPSNKEAYLKFARGYKNLNKNLALQKLEELLKVDPNYIPAYAIIGDIHYGLGNYKSAIEAYEKFISIPGVPMKQEQNYAELLYFTDQFDKSLAQIEKVLKVEPNNLVMLRLQGYNNFKLENYDAGIQMMTEFLSKSDADDHIYLDYITLGRLYLAKKQNDEAIAALKKAEEFENANLPEVYKELTTAYENKKEYPEAIKYYEKFFAAEGAVPVSFDYYYYGYACYLEAADYFTKMQAEDAPKDSIPTWDMEFKTIVEKGSGAFDQVIDRSPDSHLGYIFKARINSLVDSRQQTLTEKMDGIAKPFYENAIAVMEANNANGARDKDLIESYNYLGSFYYVNGDNAQAGEYFKKILALNPDHAGAKAVLQGLGIRI